MDLTKAESLIRAHADDTVPVPCLTDKEREALAIVLAEYDRRGATEQRGREVYEAAPCECWTCQDEAARTEPDR